MSFTQEELGWLPWLEPLFTEELTERHWAGLVDASRAKSPYFLLLARGPEVLEARTKTEKDIFYNTSSGLPRAERELRQRRHRVSTAASSVRPFTRGLLRFIPSVAPISSGCSIRASMRIRSAMECCHRSLCRTHDDPFNVQRRPYSESACSRDRRSGNH